jgi:hypothetical protein
MKKSYNNLLGKVIRRIGAKEKTLIMGIEKTGKGVIKLWLKKGTWINKKQLGNYEIFWQGWKPLITFFRGEI